jgi:thioester reductase-like protein
MKIARLGQLTGDTRNGIWNMKEAWPLMLSTVHTLGCLPDLDEKLSWLPMDVAVRAICDIAEVKSDTKRKDEGCEVFHVVNNSTATTWKDLLKWLKQKKEFEVVEPRVWLEKLEAFEDHPAKQLLGLWRQAFGEGGKKKETVFETKNMERVSEVMRNVPGVGEELVGKIWAWMEGERKKGQDKKLQPEKEVEQRGGDEK